MCCVKNHCDHIPMNKLRMHRLQDWAILTLSICVLSAPLFAAPMTDDDIFSRIKTLVDEEHHLTGSDDAAERRRAIEEQLDQCWDLLRQRQARREFGADAMVVDKSGAGRDAGRAEQFTLRRHTWINVANVDL